MIDTVLLLLDYRRAREKASRLEEIAGEIENEARNRLGSSIEELGSNWKGDNAAAFLYKAEVMQEDLLEQATKLRRIASTIRSAAKKVYDAEIAAAEIFK
ncbi:MAG: WXG100 family type VII secretion target [Clostridia bacterium]|nr:WXG100 family type VII secretion target [Clostridia bacterium]